MTKVRQVCPTKLVALAVFALTARQAFVAPHAPGGVHSTRRSNTIGGASRAARGDSRRSTRTLCKLCIQGENCVRAKLTYQGDAVHRSLVAEGKVGSKEGQAFGSSFVSKTVLVKDGRSHNLTLDQHGFTLVQDMQEPMDYFSEKTIFNDYYPSVCKLIKKVTGAEKVFPFDHNLRSRVPSAAGKKRQSAGNEILGPVLAVHNDYSEASALRQVQQLAEPFREGHKLRQFHGATPLIDPSELDDILKNRWAFVKVWRNIRPEPIRRHPFALCEGPSIPLDDIVTFEATFAKRNKEYYFAGHSKSHRWFYFPEQTRDEAILFKTWDSAGAAFGDSPRKVTVPATYAFHTAFDDPDTPEWAEERESLEVVTVACWPSEENSE